MKKCPECGEIGDDSSIFVKIVEISWKTLKIEL